MERYPTRRSEVSPLLGDFGRIFNQLMPAMGRGWNPALDAFRDEGDLVYRMDVPGVSREDIVVKAENGYLVISGERKAEIARDGYFERSHGSFTRSVALPRGVTDEAVQAKLDDGVLTVRVSLPDTDSESKSIPID